MTDPIAIAPDVRQRYRIISSIGRGGMAELLLVAVSGAGGVTRLAVVKRIWPELASDPDFVAMFVDEARLSVRMSHPNVVQTHEVLGDRGGLAIVMEYLDGQPLSRVINRVRGRSALSLKLWLGIISNVLTGLDYAHELRDYDGTPLGVVHRDVSAHNVFVTYDGNVKLVDFGVAKNLAGSHQTRPGTLKGKFAYMAPEQFRGGPVDRRADVFSVGVMLWEMVAGQRFWNGLSDAAIAARIGSEHPLPRLPSGLSLPDGLEAICARALERDPARRYPTAAAMEADLGRVLTTGTESYARSLGRVMSVTFAAERAERRALIDRCLREGRFGSWSDLSAVFDASADTSVDLDQVPTRSTTSSAAVAALATEMRHPVAPPPQRGVRGLLARVAGPALLVCAGMAASLTVGHWIARRSLAARAAIAARVAATPGAAPEARRATDARAVVPGPAPAAVVRDPAGAAPARLAISLAASSAAGVVEEPAHGRRSGRDATARSRRTTADGRRRTEDRVAGAAKLRAEPGARAGELFDEEVAPPRKNPRARAIDVSDPF